MAETFKNGEQNSEVDITSFSSGPSDGLPESDMDFSIGITVEDLPEADNVVADPFAYHEAGSEVNSGLDRQLSFEPPVTADFSSESIDNDISQMETSIDQINDFSYRPEPIQTYESNFNGINGLAGEHDHDEYAPTPFDGFPPDEPNPAASFSGHKDLYEPASQFETAEEPADFSLMHDDQPFGDAERFYSHHSEAASPMNGQIEGFSPFIGGSAKVENLIQDYSVGLLTSAEERVSQTVDGFPEITLPSANLAGLFDGEPAEAAFPESADELAAKEAIIMEELKSQMSWYSKKCRTYKRADTVSQMIMMVIAGSIPVITAFNFESNKYIIIVISAFMVFLEGVRNFMKYKEKWLIYRDTLETLKKEKLMYAIGVGPYTGSDRLKILGRRYIQAISTENEGWRKEVYQPEGGGKS